MSALTQQMSKTFKYGKSAAKFGENLHFNRSFEKREMAEKSGV